MAKEIIQYRYYKDNDIRNWPSDLDRTALREGSLFNDQTSIVQLGIQTMPGVKVYLNSSNFPIVIGPTGIYELNLDGVAAIRQMRFDENSLEMINNLSTSYLIIDIINEKVIE